MRRLRKNRHHPGVRRLLKAEHLHIDELICPVFVKAGLKAPVTLRLARALPMACERHCRSCGLPCRSWDS